MPAWIINDIQVNAVDGISYEEALHYVHEEQLQWEQQKKKIARIELSLVNDGLDVEIKAYERSPITRIRRITGYLASTDKFNDAKLAELQNRKAHIETGVI
ncbi:TPA: hypothetical protein ENX78_11950 [Candidatus Poribacteria bacterium]|nr:hypothetical protein [Candidatus Poribacteria bacterium]